MNLQIGQRVVSIGNPFLATQSYSNLVTTGIISKTNVEAIVEEEFETMTILNAIVTDAPIAGGFSGGPLLNGLGHVIGVTAASDVGEQCCSYAIPSNTVSQIVPSLIETGEYIHPWIGIEPVSLNANQQARELIPDNIQGVIVYGIERDGPAHKAGLKGSIINEFNEEQVGDIIMEIDGEPVNNADEFNAYIEENKSAGENVVLTIFRNGGISDVEVLLEANPYY